MNPEDLEGFGIGRFGAVFEFEIGSLKAWQCWVERTHMGNGFKVLGLGGLRA